MSIKPFTQNPRTVATNAGPPAEPEAIVLQQFDTHASATLLMQNKGSARADKIHTRNEAKKLIKLTLSAIHANGRPCVHLATASRA